ncbi:MAG: hypothetical protein Pg6B_10330 [Candidatus Azobacteroides pseudotrichonymphae]|nr:MAG: hypothetical protein Ta2E_09180 [Mycoplasmoidaceae bacterium]GMO38098.1 MAG: hypothetical protein Pg6B_10330 [Candidatus Azobacteroides pseudotrichonymphae]
MVTPLHTFMTLDTRVTATFFSLAKCPYEQECADLKHLPPLAEGEWMIGDNTMWSDKAEAQYRALLDIQQNLSLKRI